MHTPNLATLKKTLIPPKIMINLSPYTCHYKHLWVIMQTNNLSPFMPLMPSNRDDTLLQHILHVFICSVTVNCNCIPGRKVRIRKIACKKVCFPMCLHLLGCSSSLPLLLSAHCFAIWCALSAKVYHNLCSPVHAAPFIFLVIHFNSVPLHISLFFLFLFFLSIGYSQLASIDLLAASHFLHLKLTMFHW